MENYRRLIAQLSREKAVVRLKVSEAVADFTQYIMENAVRIIMSYITK